MGEGEIGGWGEFEPGTHELTPAPLWEAVRGRLGDGR